MFADQLVLLGSCGGLLNVHPEHCDAGPTALRWRPHSIQSLKKIEKLIQLTTALCIALRPCEVLGHSLSVSANRQYSTVPPTPKGALETQRVAPYSGCLTMRRQS